MVRQAGDNLRVVLTEEPILRVFVRALTRNVWTALVFAATLVTLLLVPRQWYWLAPTGLAATIVVAVYRTVEVMRLERSADAERLRAQRQAEVDGLLAEQRREAAGLRSEIARRDEEIARLKVRSYDETKRRHVEETLGALSIPGKDLLRRPTIG